MDQTTEAAPRKLWRVEVTKELLVWAAERWQAVELAERYHEDEDNEEFRADVARLPVTAAEGNSTAWGAPYIPIRLLLLAGDKPGDPEGFRLAFPATMGSETWYSDGFAAFPEPLDNWIFDPEAKTHNLSEKIADRLVGLSAGLIPVVEIHETITHGEEINYRLRDGLEADPRYVDPVTARHAGVIWRHDGTKGALIGEAEGQIVAVIMPINAHIGAGAWPAATLTTPSGVKEETHG